MSATEGNRAFAKQYGFPEDDPQCYAHIPEYTLGMIHDWVQRGIPGGDFMEAILTNDLRRAVDHGDLENLRAIPAIVAYLFNRCPIGCWGSVEHYQEWYRQKHKEEVGDV